MEIEDAVETADEPVNLGPGKSKRKRVYGPALKFEKVVDRGGWYGLNIKATAFDNFLNERRGKGKGVFMIADHEAYASNLLASEDNGTFRFYQDRDNFLDYEAFITQDDDATAMQSDVLKLVKQKLLTQVSIGLEIREYSWNLDDEKYPVMNVLRAGARELSVVVRGAMENDATIRMSLAEPSDHASKEVCNVRLLEVTDNGETYVEMDVRKSLDEALAAKHASESTETEDASEEDDESDTTESLSDESNDTETLEDVTDETEPTEFLEQLVTDESEHETDPNDLTETEDLNDEASEEPSESESEPVQEDTMTVGERLAVLEASKPAFMR